MLGLTLCWKGLDSLVYTSMHIGELSISRNTVMVTEVAVGAIFFFCFLTHEAGSNNG